MEKKPKVEVKRILTPTTVMGGLPCTRSEKRYRVGGLWRTRAAAVNYLVDHYDMGRYGAGAWLDMLPEQD